MKPSQHLIEILTLESDDAYQGYAFLDLAAVLLECNVTEDIYSKSLAIHVKFFDGSDINNKFDFDGRETIKAKFKSAGNEFIDLEFQVWKDAVTPNPDGTGTKIIDLWGVTKEHYIQQRIDINQSYKGKISEFAKIVYGKFSTGKPFEVDPTSGRLTTIIPGMTPFESMDFLANRSFSGKYPTSWFLFYEGIAPPGDGTAKYFFKNAEQLIDENKGSALPLTYSPSSVADETLINRQEVIDDLAIVTNKDVMKKFKRGMYASQVNEIDMITHRVLPTNFNIDESRYKEFVHLDDENMSLDSKKQIEENLAIINTSYWQTRTFDSGFAETHFGTIIPRRLFYLNSLQQVVARMQIPGNSDLRVGKCFDLDMLEQTTKSETREQEHKVSGKYWVTKITHNFTRDAYKCFVEMCKESYRANTRKPDKNYLG